jgi:hypothetical protein
MEWKNKFFEENNYEKGFTDEVSYRHENYNVSCNTCSVESRKFDNDKLEVSGMEIMASIDNYDIVKTLGEDSIRKTVGDAYRKFIAEKGHGAWGEKLNTHAEIDAEVEKYLNDYKEASRVIIAGGRDFDDYKYMSSELTELFENSAYFKGITIKIISGMAKGADSLAIRYADEHKLTKILFPANWKAYPRIAGFLRNNDMLSIATHLIAFWDGKSRGTKHMIDFMTNKNLPVKIVEYETTH